jgi:hypothetical protein
VTRRLAASLVLLALASCTQSGTGVDLTIGAGGLMPDELQIVATYDDNQHPQTVSVPSGTPLRLVAQLPDRDLSVTFKVTALQNGRSIGYGMTAPIDVPAHTIVPATLLLQPCGTWCVQSGGVSGMGAITGIWGPTAREIYAVSTSANGANLFHTTDGGVTWLPQLVGGGVDLDGVGGTLSGDDVYLVGNNAVLLHGSGTSWTNQMPPFLSANTRLNSVWALSAMDVYVVGSTNTIIHSVTGGWVQQTPVGTTEYHGVWGVTGHIWAVGSGGTIMHSTGGGTWTMQTSNTGYELRAVFGTSETDVWVVGDNGTVLHYDGNSWAPPAGGLPAGTTLLALGGASGGPVWGAGTDFTVMRRDATMWVPDPTGLAGAGLRLRAIFVPSLSEIYAGGDDQIILHRK